MLVQKESCWEVLDPSHRPRMYAKAQQRSISVLVHFDSRIGNHRGFILKGRNSNSIAVGERSDTHGIVTGGVVALSTNQGLQMIR